MADNPQEVLSAASKALDAVSSAVGRLKADAGQGLADLKSALAQLHDAPAAAPEEVDGVISLALRSGQISLSIGAGPHTGALGLDADAGRQAAADVGDAAAGAAHALKVGGKAAAAEAQQGITAQLEAAVAEMEAADPGAAAEAAEALNVWVSDWNAACEAQCEALSESASAGMESLQAMDAEACVLPAAPPPPPPRHSPAAANCHRCVPSPLVAASQLRDASRLIPGARKPATNIKAPPRRLEGFFSAVSELMPSDAAGALEAMAEAQEALLTVCDMLDLSLE